MLRARRSRAAGSRCVQKTRNVTTGDISCRRMTTPELPTFEDVSAAARRTAGHAHRTPVMRSRTIDAELDAEVFFKCENLQRMGAFKFRGAFNALSKFDDAQRRAGVVAFSSGNHAQGIA